MGYAVYVKDGDVQLGGGAPFIGSEVDAIRGHVEAAIDITAVENGYHVGYAKIEPGTVNPVQLSLFPEVLERWGAASAA